MIYQRLIVIALMATSLTVYAFTDQIKYPQISGVIWISIWALSAYEDILAEHGFLRTIRQKLKLGLAASISLLYFLPVVPEVALARGILQLGLLAVLLFMQDS